MPVDVILIMPWQEKWTGYSSHTIDASIFFCFISVVRYHQIANFSLLLELFLSVVMYHQIVVRRECITTNHAASMEGAERHMHIVIQL
jgi:hypothetical protein